MSKDMMDLVSYLESKDLQVKPGGSGNVYTHCWNCNEDDSKRGRLYIQADPESELFGAYFCHICHAKGGLNAIRKHFGDELIKEASSGTPIIRAAVSYYADKLLENIDAYNYLVEKRGLSHETIKRLKFGWADGGLLTHLIAHGFQLEDIKAEGLINHFGEDFLKEKITIPYLVFGEPVTIRGKDIQGKYLSLPGSTARLYGLDSIRGQDTVVIAAGEFDCAVLQQMGYSAVGVPGENIWKPEWTELLSDAKRIYVLFDPDAAGKAGAEKLGTKLGPRARLVDLPDPLPGKKIDVSSLYVDQGKTREDFDFLMSKAKGGLLISPAQAYDRWMEFEGNPDLSGLRFNIDAIDSEMKHGLLPGQVVTMLARTNCLVGDTDLIVNRAGKSFHTSIENLVYRFKGGFARGKKWDEDIPTTVQRRADDGTVRLVEIQDAWCSGVKEVYRLWTVCGRDIKATAQHPFLTDDGYRMLGDLSPGDRVYVNVGKGQMPERGSTPRRYRAKNMLDKTELTEIAGIEYLGEEVTYDIEVVDDPHNFIANEFVVHNTGKTLFSLNILHRMRMAKPDLKILFLSLEQMRNEWFERAHRIHSFYDPGVTTLDTVNYWKNNLFIVDENRISEETLEMCIEQYNFETGSPPDLVLIDYLGYYARSFQGEEYSRTTAAIMGLKAIAKRNQLVFLVPHQANRSNDMGSEVRLDQGRGAGTVEETSDVSLMLWNPDQRKPDQEGLVTKSDQKRELILKMAKSRDGGVNTMCFLQTAPLSLAIVPKDDPVFYERALRERQYWIAGMSHKDAIRAYLTGDESIQLTKDGNVV